MRRLPTANATCGRDHDQVGAGLILGDGPTQHGEEYPETDDLAAAAPYAWALTQYRERVSLADASAWSAPMAHRIAFIDSAPSVATPGDSPISELR